MSKSLKFGVLLVTVFLVGGSLLSLSAQSTQSQAVSPVNIGSHHKPATVIFNRKLASTSQSWDCCSVVAVGAGFVALDSPLKFTCPSGGTCSISAEENVQVSGSTTGNLWAICAAVDGNYMAEPSCPYLGLIPADGSYLAGSFVQNMSAVTPGNHTLQTFVYTLNGGNRAVYNITYRLYRP